MQRLAPLVPLVLALGCSGPAFDEAAVPASGGGPVTTSSDAGPGGGGGSGGAAGGGGGTTASGGSAGSGGASTPDAAQPVLGSCEELLAAAPATPSGAYTVSVGGSEMTAQCDMTTDGGGWTLVLNYVHKGGTNPELATLEAQLPLIGSSTLGDDESGDPNHWGHVDPKLLSQLSFSETLWQASTSAHSRVIEFVNASPHLIGYMKSGAGGLCSYTGELFSATMSTPLAEHTAHLPLNTTSMQLASCDKGTRAMTEFPFFSQGEAHWGIRGQGTRWEADDSLAGFAHDTIHRVWVR
ncbi:MAG: hypothetical protein H6717_36390 [Polyangiaceae bacterium]|nr:hypothetical protein [Polyangiaceae bacterium]